MEGAPFYAGTRRSQRPVLRRFRIFQTGKAGKKDFVSYRDALKKTIGGYRQALRPEADVVVVALDAATTGRLSVTYYNQLMASDFLARIERWWETCCWDSRRFGCRLRRSSVLSTARSAPNGPNF
ncbi:MAG: type I-C CRISPR-associated protein Cas8c/Csd1 [Hydrogeniiclostridium mannosilyticum]